MKITVLIGLSVFVLATCQQQQTAPVEPLPENGFLNWGDSAQYVGKTACAQCHNNRHKTFMHTGMGLSFDTVSAQKSAARLSGGDVLYDSVLGFAYTPFWRHDSLLVTEQRDGGHERTQLVHYIIGSGQHTNSHIFSENGYLFQAPFTYYTQLGVLDFPPGFEDGNNSRFSRPIGLECMSCHNAMPTGFLAGSENKFNGVPKGIDCERCHGPGSIHVNRMNRGKIVDTAKRADRSIVNPRRLSPALQFEICQRCHLQGNTVLAQGKNFFDFKPGMHLDSVMDVYLPRYADADDQFIMASHADRLKQSACFRQSNAKLTCTTCHNPHVSVAETGVQTFNNACISCHGADQGEHGCTRIFKHLDDNNCVGCHMPQSGSIDIPHVTVHDHHIKVPTEKKAEKERGVFLGLTAVNNLHPTKRSKIRAYLQQYERFEQNAAFLDSALKLLQRVPLLAYKGEWVHYYYLRNDPAGIVGMVDENGKHDKWLASLNEQSLANADAWTSYRIAEAYRKFGDYPKALAFAQQAVQLAPHHPPFVLKLGSIYALLQDFETAKDYYAQSLAMNSQQSEGWSDLGYVQLALGDVDEAEKSLKKALALDPDYLMAKVNLASVYMAAQQFDQARYWLEEVLKFDPENKRVNAALDYLNEQNL